MRQVPVHYLRPNEGVNTPRSVAYIDTAYTTTETAGGELATLRCWAGALVVRRPSKGHPPADLIGWGTTAAELALWLGVAAGRRDSLWVYAHDLGRDLVTSRLPQALTGNGWSVTDFAVSALAPWLRLRQGRRGITLTDSWSILPAPIDQLAAMCGTAIPHKPPADADLSFWVEWCHGQVRGLASAMETVMAWWDDRGLGRWNITGPSTGWAAMRHTLQAKDILIDPEPERQSHDRLAIHSGRRGVNVVADLHRGPYLELDLADAYPSVAAHLPLPRRRGIQIDGRRPGQWGIVPGQWEPLAECVIRTDVPRFPWRHRKGVLYPVGEFVTTLAGPDIAEAKALGCLVEMRAGWLHELGVHLQPWARWVIDVTHGRDEYAPAVAAVAGKAWGRSVIGKFATRAWERERLGDWHPGTWRYEDGWSMPDDVAGGMVWLDGAVWWTHQAQIGPEAYPAVNAWVEAHTRVRIGRVAEALGRDCVLLINTDGLVVDGQMMGTKAAGGTLIAPQGMRATERRAWVLEQLQTLTAPLTLRIKARHSSVTIMGPQTYRLGDDRRVSGIPKTAKANPDGSLSYQTWPSLSWQLAHGQDGGALIRHLTASALDPAPTGWLTTAGRVLPVVTRLDDAGVTQLVPWAQTIYAQGGHKLHPKQHPALRPLV